MENLWLWQFIAFAVAVFYTVGGIQTLKQRDDEFISSMERAAKRNADFDRITEKEAVRKYVDARRKEAGSWRLIFGMRQLALGVVAWVVFLALIILKYGT